ncbi:MAG: hypothetical protein ACTH2Q_11055 [Propionibacteriaceae bacterium]
MASPEQNLLIGRFLLMGAPLIGLILVIADVPRGVQVAGLVLIVVCLAVGITLFVRTVRSAKGDE